MDFEAEIPKYSFKEYITKRKLDDPSGKISVRITKVITHEIPIEPTLSCLSSEHPFDESEKSNLENALGCVGLSIKDSDSKDGADIEQKFYEYTGIIETTNPFMLLKTQFGENSLNAFMYACAKHAYYPIVEAVLQKILSLICFIAKAAEKESTDENIFNEQTYPILEELFFNFFYQRAPCSLDGKASTYNAMALAIIHDRRDTGSLIENSLKLSATYDEYAENKKQIEESFDKATNKVGDKQRGHFESKKGVLQVKPRNFRGDREKQLLKQLSTVLFFCIKQNKPGKAVETQVLHLHVGKTSHLFISCNGGDSLSEEIKKIKTVGDLQNQLSGQVNVRDPRDKEGLVRLPRYKKNLESIFSKSHDDEKSVGYTLTDQERSEDIMKYHNIVRLLQTKETKVEHYAVDKKSWYQEKTIKMKKKVKTEICIEEKMKNLLDKVLADDGNSVVVIFNTENGKKMRHAEEYLVDVVETVRVLAEYKKSNLNIYSAIGGKKRPCTTCFGTMTRRQIDTFGEQPGFAWKTSLKQQELTNAMMVQLFMLGRKSHVTISSSGDPAQGYDTGSDEEEVLSEQAAYQYN